MSSGSHPNSVRQLYAPPADDFLFLPPTLPPSSSSSSLPNASSSSSGSSSFFSSSSSQPGPTLVLPSISRSSFPSFSSLSPSGTNWSESKDAILWASAGAFLSSFLAQPFEAGKVLAQVQCLPRLVGKDGEALGPAAGGSGPSGGEGRKGQGDEQDDGESDDDDNLSDTSSGDRQAYFEDLLASSRINKNRSALQSQSSSRRPVDADGYVLRTVPGGSGPKTGSGKVGGGGGGEGEKLEWVLPRAGYQGNGPWSMTKRLWRGEGPSGPWKGLWVAIISDSLTSYIPPIVQSSLLSPLFLSSSFASSSSSSSSTHSQIFSLLLPTIFSHSLTGFILSPLDLLRTRLIVQSSSRKHRTYTSPYNPLSSLRTIVRDEGGWISTYFHPTLFWPTFWDITLRSLVSIATPLIIEQTFNVSLVTSPVTYRALEALLSIGSLLITLPIETARRRLQIQSRSPLSVSPNQTGGIKTCVEVRGRPYSGLLECLWRIVQEESSSGGAGVWSGIKMLYRGFGLNMVASGCVFGLEAFLWAIGRESGWKEI